MEVAQGLQYKADRAKRGAMVKAANPLNEVVKVRASRGQPLKGHRASVGDRLQRVHQVLRSEQGQHHFLAPILARRAPQHRHRGQRELLLLSMGELRDLGPVVSSHTRLC